MRHLLYIALGIVLGVSVRIAARSAGGQEVFKGCGIAGKTKGQCTKALNRLKNRYQAPDTAQVNHAITLDAILAPGDDEARWNPQEGAEIVGYVAKVSRGGAKESCNCGLKDLQDIHIDVVRSPADAADATRHLIVEITPRWKAKKHWDIRAVRRTINHKWVKFRGWMFFDSMHLREAANTRQRTKQGCGNLPARETWRATA